MKTLGARLGWMAPVLTGLVAACSDGGLPPTQQLPAQTLEALQDPNTCNTCHQDHFKEWSGSMHAYASTDPVFRAMNARGQKETNGALGPFCVKCHAPMAVLAGATQDGTNLDSVPQKLQGITCYFCHNVSEVTDVHNNNPLVLSNDRTMRGGIKSPTPFGAHPAEYSQLFDDDAAQAGFQSSSLCGSCHDIVVPGHFSGSTDDVKLEQTFAEWGTSVFADPNSTNLRLNCTSGGGCHMDREARVPIANPPLPHPTMPTRSARHLHNFPAIDTALTDFPEKDAQLTAVQDKLSTEFRIQICADGPKTLGTGLVTIQLENLSAGHNMPSGATQDRRFWIEVHAYKQGTELKSPSTVPVDAALPSGVVPAGVAATTIAGTWILYDQATKVDKTPAHMFWDVANLNPTVIPVSTSAMPTQNVLGHRPFSGVTQPDRVTVTIWIEAIGLDVIDDMVESTFLDKSIRDKVQRFPVLLAAARPDPTPDNTPVTFEWTLAQASDPDVAYVVTDLTCLENTQPKFGVMPPPAL